MKYLKSLGLLVLVTLMVPMPLIAEQRDPGYIVGEIRFPGFTTTSLSMTAVGGGHTFQKTIYGSSNYQMVVEGGDWNYSATSSCGLSGGNNNALTVSFNQRSFPVTPGEMVTNDYIYNSGTIRFQVNITGDSTISASAAGSWATKAVTSGEKTATYSSGTPATTARSFSWDIPVVPNQQIELTAKIDIYGPTGVKQGYTFSKTAAGPYNLELRDVAPGELVIVPLEVNFVEGEPSSPVANNKGTVTGNVSLLGLSPYNFIRHNANGKNIPANPGEHSRDFSFPANQFISSINPPNTYFDESVDSFLRWPYINGNSQSNKVTVYPDTTTYIDFERAGGSLIGRINLYGTIQNEDLKAITFNFTGLGNVYDAVTKKWSFLENYYGAANLKRDATLSNVKRPSERDYQLFLTTGDWELASVTLSRQLTSPSRTSSVTFIDYNTRFNNQTYFGTPIHIAPGTNEKDFNYCFGSAIFRFFDSQGRLLRDPFVVGKGTYQENGTVDLNVSSISAHYSSTNFVEVPEVELFGPPADYLFSIIRVLADDGTTITFPPRNLSFTCNTTKILDFPGPTLNVLEPKGGMITNASSLLVSGRAFGGSTIGSVTVNDQSAILTPVSGGNPNEVTFNYDLPLTAGGNTLTVTANEVSGAQATDQLIISVDHWQPTVSIITPTNGDSFLSTETSLPLRVEAADRGYGYTLAVYLNGTLVHSTSGAANIMDSVALDYDGVLRALSVGEHVITATASDIAGNSTSSSISISIGDPPPVLYGLDDQIIEASSEAGAVASFDVTATATACDAEPAPKVLPSPILTPQSNSTSLAGNMSKTFQWDAVTAADGQAVQYQVQVSNGLDFGIIHYSSPWQSGTSWMQSLPTGTWYWRVIARDGIYTTVQSSPATGNSFSIYDGNTGSIKFNVQNHTGCTLSGGVYPNTGDAIWVGPFFEDGGSEVDRSFIAFDTSALAEEGTITEAKLILNYQYNEYVEEASITTVYESTWQFPGDATTYYNVGAYLASQSIAVSRPLGIVAFSINPDYIQTSGLTKFALAAANENFGYPVNSAPGYSRATSYLEITKTAIWAAPILMPQGNVTSSAEMVDTTMLWAEVTTANGDPVEYLVEISTSANFSTIDFSSPWQTLTNWTQALPTGAWYWRVTARDGVLMSARGASSFIIAYLPPPAPPEEVTVICSANSGDIFPLGATTVTCTASDACNRSTVGSFTITVQDTAPPTLALPDDVITEATSAEGTPVIFHPTSTDSVDPAPTVTCLPESGSIFSIGDSTVWCIARDVSGNTTTGTFNVTVNASLPPVLTVPPDKSVEASGILTPVDIGQATATHNLPVTIASDAPPEFVIGITPVTWTATDTNGKTASGIQNITVMDTTAPMVTAPGDLTVEATGNLTTITIGAATATDAVGVISLTSDAPESFPVGVTTVTWTATDAAGNAGTSVQAITVTDLTPPVLQGLTNQVLEATSAAGAAADFTITASDLVDPAPAISCSASSGSTFPLGETTVTCMAADAAGNSANGSFTIVVKDTTPPIITVPANLTVLLNTLPSSPDVQAFLNGATASDAVDATVTVTSSVLEAFDTVGEKQVVFTAADSSGNQSSGTAIVRVVYGCGDEFLAPVGLLKPLKLKSTIPVKIEFCDASGSPITSAVVRLFLYPVSDDVPSEVPMEIQSNSNADTDSYFRVSGDTYIYNLDTKNLSSGTYQVRVAPDDGTIRTVPLALKQ